MTPRERLLEQQRAFLAQLLEDARPAPAGWAPERLAIYRNAYRTRLVDALRETFPRTCRWVGDEAFERAAAHHLICRPPASWTLDAVGVAFADTLGELFARDPEVPELAWLEWAMHACYVSADAQALDAAAFAVCTADFDDEAWADLHLAFLPGTRATVLTHHVDRLWRDLGPQADEVPSSCDPAGEREVGCIVWREGLSPVFAAVAGAEARALTLLQDGASYGELCAGLIDDLGEAGAVAEAGAMLGRWLHRGLIADAW